MAKLLNKEIFNEEYFLEIGVDLDLKNAGLEPFSVSLKNAIGSDDEDFIITWCATPETALAFAEEYRQVNDKISIGPIMEHINLCSEPISVSN